MPEGRSDNGSARARGAKDREAPLPLLLAVLGWTPRDAVAFVVGIVAVVAILVNSLSLQSGSHPAPLFEPAEVEKTVQGPPCQGGYATGGIGVDEALPAASSAIWDRVLAHRHPATAPSLMVIVFNIRPARSTASTTCRGCCAGT